MIGVAVRAGALTAQGIFSHLPISKIPKINQKMVDIEIF